MPLAVIALQFDPYLRAGDLAIRLETIALALAALAGVLLAARFAERYRDEFDLEVRLPSVDVLLFTIAAIPGAVIGGRLGYGLVHADYYAGRPLLLFDASTGGFELGLAVVGGVATGGFFARALGSRVGAWLQVIAVPLLLALGLGKVAGALGGTGQGAPWDGLVSTAYLGPGPWGSLDPSGAAWPAQVIEGVAVLLGAAMLLVLLAPEPAVERDAERLPAPPFRLLGASPVVPDGRGFFIALWIWATLRVLVAFAWRDAPVLGPLRTAQLISLAIAGGSAFLYVLYATRPGAVLVPVIRIREEAAPADAPEEPPVPEPPKRRRAPKAPVDPDLKPVRKRKPAAAAPPEPARRGGRTIEDVLSAGVERRPPDGEGG